MNPAVRSSSFQMFQIRVPQIHTVQSEKAYSKVGWAKREKTYSKVGGGVGKA